MIGLFLATLLQSAASLFMKLASAQKGGFTSLCLFYYGVPSYVWVFMPWPAATAVGKDAAFVAYLSNGLLCVYVYLGDRDL